MRSKHLLLMLLLALMAPWVANAQGTETLTVYDGTNTNSYIPFNGLYADYGTRSQFIIPSGELEELVGGTIQKLTFYSSTASTTYNEGVTVYLKEVDYTVFESAALEDWSTMTAVWTGNLTVSDNQMEIVFSSPYTYNGDNLMIGFQVTEWGSSCPSIAWYGVNQTTDTYTAAYNNANSSHTWSSSIYRQNFLPKTTFTYTPGSGATCDKPETLDVSSVSAHGATLTWTGGSDTYNVEYKKASDETWTSHLANTNVLTTNLTGLAAGEAYQARVQSVCTNPPTSGWKTASFVTDCDAITTFPWSETFESYDAGDFSDLCWVNERIQDGTGSSGSLYIYQVNTSSQGGNTTHQLKLPDMKAGTITELRLPEMTLPNNNYQFVIDVYRDNNIKENEGIKILASADGAVEGATELGFIKHYYGYAPTETTTGWYTYEFPISFSGTCYIIILGYSQWGTATYMDNFSIEETPTCAKPSSLMLNTPSAKTAHTATLKWTNGEEGQNAWQIAYSTETDFDPNTVTPVDVTTNPATITGLAANTDYYAYVRANCGSADGMSAWCTNKTHFKTTVGNAAPTGLACPSATLESSTAVINWTGVATNDNHESFDLYYALATVTEVPAEPTTPNFIAGITSNTNTLTGLNPETEYKVWVRDNCGTDGISEWTSPITFTTLAACPPPTGLVASEITNHTAKLAWTGTSESYNVSYRTKAYSIGVDEEFNTTSVPTNWTRWSGQFDETAGTATLSTGSGWSFGTGNGVFDNHAKANIFSTGCYKWLVTPAIELSNGATLSFDVALTKYSGTLQPVDPESQQDDKFIVLISIDEEMGSWTVLRKWDNAGSTYVYNNIACSATGEHINIDLTSYVGQTVFIAFYGESTASGGDNNLHIDNVAIGTPVAAGEWQNINGIEANNVTLQNLLAERKYEAKLQGNCGDEGMSTEVGPITFTTDIACPAPTGLAASNATSSSFDLSWTNGGSEDWIVAYKKATDAGFTEVVVNMTEVTEEAGLITYTLGGLEEKKEYTVKVRDNCEPSYTGDGVSDWTTEVVYSTVAACSALNPVVSNITHHNATVNWDGESASGFTVKYRTSGAINPDDTELEEGFEHSGSMPEGWTHIGNGSLTINTTASRVHTGSYSLRFSGATSDNVVVLPELGVEANTMLISFWSLAESSTLSGTFQVGYVTDAEDASTFHTVGNYEAKDQLEYTHVENVSLASAPANARIAFRHTSASTSYWWWIDDVVIGAPAGTGTWQDQTATTTSADLTGLTAGTMYDVKVVPNCDETKESETVQFTTVSGDIKWFINEGNWDDDDNWEPEGEPTIDQDVVLKANATIATGTAYAKSIAGTGTGDNAKTLTIENGAKLKHLNSGVRATVKKTITGYGAGNENDKADYYLIANPLTSTVYKHTSTSNPNISSTGMLTGNYDLYSWSYDGSEGNEWRNYEASAFDLSAGAYGYLYANETTTTLSFTGTINAYTGSKDRYLSTTTSTSYDFPAWYLLGNPYLYDAYLANGSSATATALPYYRMNDDGDGFEAIAAATLTPIAPMEGFFYKATSNASVYVTTTTPVVPDAGLLNMSLRSGNKKIDNAIVTFGDEQRLEKLSFRQGSSKIYMPVENKDYAIVNAESNAGEMPVSFKAEKNGSYTLSFSNENVEFGYLHLIDNMTGMDVDLLQNPSYSFEAKTTDYGSRFKLVFSTGNGVNEESFAFISDGNIILNGEGMLQVVDVMGRIMMQEENATSVSTSGMTPGVYVLRLINGDSVKTQKIVIK